MLGILNTFYREYLAVVLEPSENLDDAKENLSSLLHVRKGYNLDFYFD